MTLGDCTLVIGIDSIHLEELRMAWPTWVRFKPELMQMPLVVFYDPWQVSPADAKFLEKDHQAVRWVAWEHPCAQNQREKMIAGFLHVPAKHVFTTWYLKLDTDAVATGPGEWIKPEWFRPNGSGKLPVFVSSRWGYSKPRYVVELLDDWGDRVLDLKRYPRLNIPYATDGKSRVFHKRIISWIFFGNTEWTRRVVGWLPADGRLPWPSQDTFLFYCAKRSREHYVREDMGRYLWRHRPIRGRRETNIDYSPVDAGSASPTRGVIYYNVGTSCAARLAVSLSSLRRNYSGSVTILSEGRDSDEICRQIADQFDADFRSWNCDVPEGPNRVYLAKANYHQGTPYSTTVAIDSDTLITGSIDELFDFAEASSFCVAQLGQWRSDGNTIAKRIKAWEEWLPDEIDAALEFGPAINCGVVAFTQDSLFYRAWLPLALRGRETFIPEEVCCQIMLRKYPHRILDGRWNRSCKHDDPTAPDTRIIHYHGKKHCRAGLPYNGAAWTAEFERLLLQNSANVSAWMPAGDKTLRRWLRWGRAQQGKTGAAGK